MKRIKVAMVTPAFGPTGGPEIATINLAEALADKGIDVSLFAPADWKTKLKHFPTLYKSLWNMGDFKEHTERVRRSYIMASLTKVLRYQKDFDLIHLNNQAYAYGIEAGSNIPCLVTVHNKITIAEFGQAKKSKLYIVAVTKSQKGKNKVDAVIWHGLPVKKIKFSPRAGKYLITVGRIIDQKGIGTAIKIAQQARKELLIIGRVGNSKKRQDYFQKKIKPFLNKRIKFLGEKSHDEVLEYIKNASALLFPIRQPEVFGLVVAETLACGTPVIGTAIDPLPEILGKSGSSKVSFLSNDISSLVKAAKNIEQFDRLECRKYAEKYFDSSIMAEKYIKLYKKVIKNKGKKL